MASFIEIIDCAWAAASSIKIVDRARPGWRPQLLITQDLGSGRSTCLARASVKAVRNPSELLISLEQLSSVAAIPWEAEPSAGRKPFAGRKPLAGRKLLVGRKPLTGRKSLAGREPSAGMKPSARRELLIGRNPLAGKPSSLHPHLAGRQCYG